MAASVPAVGELFDPAFMAALDRFRLRARRVAKGGRPAGQLSSAVGAGLEFRDFRPYTPGDDIRAIDWNIHGRLGRLFVKVFEETRDLPLYLMPDVSESMFLEEAGQPRIRAALRAAFALAAVSCGQHDSVGLFPAGVSVHVEARSASGKAGLMRLAHLMAKLRSEPATDLAAAAAKFEAMALRPGLLVVISDFFEPAGLAPLLAVLGRSRHRLALIQLTRASDADPQLQGDLRLTDCETGEAVDIVANARVLDRYRAVYAAFVAELTGFARRRGAAYLRLDADGDVVAQMSALFVDGTLLV